MRRAEKECGLLRLKKATAADRLRRNSAGTASEIFASETRGLETTFSRCKFKCLIGNDLY